MLTVVSLHIIGAYLAVAFGFLVLLSDPRMRLNQLYAAFCLLISFESFAAAMIVAAETVERAMIWHDLLLVWPLTVSLLAHVVLSILDIKKKKWSNLILVFAYATLPIYLYAWWSGEVHVQLTQTGWGLARRLDTSPVSIRLLSGWTSALTLLTAIGAVVGISRAQGRLAKRRAMLLTAGTIMPLLFGVLCHAVLPRLGIVIPDLTIGGFIIGAGLLGYGIRRHGLLTISPEIAAQSIVSLMADGVFLLDADGRIARVNPAAALLVGSTPQALVGRRFSEFCADFANPWSNGMAGMDKGFTVIETDLRQSPNHKIPVSLAVAPLGHRVGMERGLLIVARDVSAPRAAVAAAMHARDEAERMSRAKSDFLANLSHEIRTPMNGVVGLVELLLDSELTPDQRDIVEIVRGSSAGLMTLIDEVLDFSKIEAGRMNLARQRLELRRLSTDVAQLFVASAAGKVEIRTSVDSAVPEVLIGDTLRLRQVLTNLVGNAVKFTPTGEIVINVTVLETRAEAIVTRITVEDTGIGIAKKHLPSLFDPFVQVDSSTTRKRGGTGLGLAIVRRLVELMGGHVGVRSELNRGSMFWIEVPLGIVQPEDLLDSLDDNDSVVVRRSALEVVGETTQAGQLSSLFPLTPGVTPCCLVVEDNPTNAKVARRILERLGCVVDGADSGAAALELLSSKVYDIIFMDCQMPEMDGFETTRRIRERALAADDPHVPIVALTALAASEDTARCFEAGMDGYLKKPVVPRDLADALTRFLPKLD